MNVAILTRFSRKGETLAAVQPEPTNHNRPPRLQQVCMVVKTLAAVASPVIAWLTYEYISRH